MHIPGPHLDSLSQNLHFNKVPGAVPCSLKLKKHLCTNVHGALFTLAKTCKYPENLLRDERTGKCMYIQGCACVCARVCARVCVYMKRSEGVSHLVVSDSFVTLRT